MTEQQSARPRRAASSLPDVSIVMPVFNAAQYLSRIEPQILGQTHQNFEWLIVDDGSTDATPRILSEMTARDSRIRILSPGRIGFVSALNLAIENARSEFIARQDVDDSSTPNRLAVQLDFLHRHPEVGVVGAYYELINEARGERFTRMPPTDHEQILRALPKYIPMAHTLVMFRREAWRQAGGYTDLKESAEDLRLWTAMAACGWRLANIPVVLGSHVEHASSFWNRTFAYAARQRVMARVQAEAIARLDLPLWMYVYPLSRLAYAYVPTALKRLLRRRIVSEQERLQEVANQ